MNARLGVVYAAAAVQGVVLVTIPAASAVFTGPGSYDLSSTRYGAMFLPQVATAIVTALAGGAVARRLGARTVFLLGLAAGLIAMLALLASYPVASVHSVSYLLLLLATAFLGAGFGLAVPAMNTLTARLRPDAVDASILVLNALLGVGTALAPLFVALFVGLGFWWGLPVLSAVLLATVLTVGARILPSSTVDTARPAPARLPRRLAGFVVFALLYGVCETLAGNWSTTDLTTGLGASAVAASIALTAFWGLVTLGRAGFASLEHRIPPQWTYRLLPLLLAVAFVAVAALPVGRPALGIAAFALAGLGCSALLPLSISLAQRAFSTVAALVPGVVIAAYQAGYGIAAFGVGPLHDHGVSLATCYAAGAVVALLLTAVATLATRRSAPRPLDHPAAGR